MKIGFIAPSTVGSRTRVSLSKGDRLRIVYNWMHKQPAQPPVPTYRKKWTTGERLEARARRPRAPKPWRRRPRPALRMGAVGRTAHAGGAPYPTPMGKVRGSAALLSGPWYGKTNWRR